ncbi:hypothetical protein BJX68DRAFT_231286 [Aspergillus pseudodeflectus]|uniref:Uncharacterized protein n=1 Tax=Aspergillus pseudodeflectus TaxID=176178 RepID=A0ABR4KRY8_9EURO
MPLLASNSHPTSPLMSPCVFFSFSTSFSHLTLQFVRVFQYVLYILNPCSFTSSTPLPSPAGYRGNQGQSRLCREKLPLLQHQLHSQAKFELPLSPGSCSAFWHAHTTTCTLEQPFYSRLY